MSRLTPTGNEPFVMTPDRVIADLRRVPSAATQLSGLPKLANPGTARTAAVLALFGPADDAHAHGVSARLNDERRASESAHADSDAGIRAAAAAAPRELQPADLDIVLQVRADTLRDHPGQMSFPGGSREPSDATPVDTALREAWEETGIEPHQVQVLGQLPQLPLVASNFMVTPVLGWRTHPADVAAHSQSESVRQLRVPLSHLLDPANRFTSVLHRAGHRFRGPAWDVDGHVLWGFTAMVLTEILDLAGWNQPWDTARERPI